METHYFTPEELRDMSSQMAELEIKRVRLDREKKTMNADYKEQIDACNGIINRLAVNITTGYEQRDEALFKAED